MKRITVRARINREVSLDETKTPPKGAHMQVRNVVFMVVLAITAFGRAGAARSQDVIHNHLNEIAVKAKATDDPAQKRAILSEGIDRLAGAVHTAKGSPILSPEDAADLSRMEATLRDKSDELGGRNGFDRVPDDQLNAFSNYVVQDMQQARSTVTIGIVTLLLIIIIIILIA